MQVALPKRTRQRRQQAVSADYYQILKIDRSASQRDVVKAYHAQALLLHPDKPTGRCADFQALCEAYETLSDDAKRQVYNLRLVSSGSCDGVRIEKFTSSMECHVLAEHLEAFIRILLSVKPSQWGRLMKGMSLEQLERPGVSNNGGRGVGSESVPNCVEGVEMLLFSN